MPSSKIGIIGLGLIGGSLARAFRLFSPECVLTAFDADPTAADAALREGVIDYKRERIDEGFSGQDYIFLCAPVAANAGYLPQIKAFLGPETILTDVGSVKTHIHETIVREGLSRSFIGGHPMTGSEKTGFSNSKALIFENAYYIMTPEPETPPDMVAEFLQFIEVIHCRFAVRDLLKNLKHTFRADTTRRAFAAGLINCELQEELRDIDHDRTSTNAFFHSVYVDRARCNGCSHCLKFCPTQAIRVRNGKAQITDKFCIDCGECVRKCVRRAKRCSYNTLEVLKNYEYNVAVPSHALYAQFNNLNDLNILATALLNLGFDAVSDIGLSKDLVDRAAAKYIAEHPEGRPFINAYCFTIVRLIRVRFPNLVDHLLPIRQPLEVAAELALDKAMPAFSKNSSTTPFIVKKSPLPYIPSVNCVRSSGSSASGRL